MAYVRALSVLFVVNIMIPEEVTADPCIGAGDTISGASRGFVSSPNFPGNFLPSQQCIWIITVPSGRIKLSFLNFTLDPDPNVITECSRAAVAPFVRLTNVASNDDNNPFELCGDEIPAPVYSVGNKIQIELISASNVYSGFNASYETITDDMLCPNASQLTDMSGVITSPYYPRNYPNNQNCLWEITASKGNRVKLEVTDMEIHRCGGDACTCDYLEILDGYLVLNTQIGGAASGKICIDGKFTPQTYYSMNEHLRVRFSSDPPAEKNSRGFTATYTQLNYSPPECPSAPILLSGNGSFSSPNYPKSNYHSGRNCFWIITASEGKRVKVTIKDFHMGWCDNCNAHYCSRVEFFDGPTSNSSHLGRFCTNSNLAAKVSSGQQMFVKFYSSFSPARGFQAEYSETTDEPTPTVTRPPTSPKTSPKTTTNTPTNGPDIFFVDRNDIGSAGATVTLANKEFLSNGNRIRYVQIIVTQLKENQQPDALTAENVDKDYKNQVEGLPYITAEFDYGKIKFRIGDGKYYSRSVRRKRRATGPREYFNGELNDGTNYAVFQRSFDSYGSYESEDVIRFTTKKSFPTTIVVVSVVVGVVVLVILVVVVFFAYRRFCKGRKTNAIPMRDTGMESGNQLIIGKNSKGEMAY